MNIRQRLTTILSYDWVAVPLVYTQVIPGIGRPKVKN